MNGISSHVEDYDDTTPKNYSHTSSPVSAALLAYASANRVRGRDFVEAFILGFEAASRVGNVVYPAHYDVGWHMTGTIGDRRRRRYRQADWSQRAADDMGARTGCDTVRRPARNVRVDGKGVSPGRSAQNGYAAALLAQAGFTSGEHGIEGPRGFAHVSRQPAICRRSPLDSGWISI